LSSTVTGLPSSYYGDCEDIGSSQLSAVPGYTRLTPAGDSLQFRVSPSSQVRFIFFESPTGQTHFFDCDGVELDYGESVGLYYQLGGRSYEIGITTNGEMNIGSYDGEVPDNTVCDGTINIFEE
jgi:hypothetical protein